MTGFSGIPKTCADLKASIRQAFLDIGYDPMKIVLCYDVDEFIDLKQKCHQAHRQKAIDWYLQDRNQKDPSKMESLALLIGHHDTAIEDLQKQIHAKESKYDVGTPTDFVGHAFVSLRTVEDRIQIFEKFQKKGFIGLDCLDWL